MTENVLWAGRLKEKPQAQAFAFQASLAVDRRLVYQDIEGSRAHVAMLAAQHIIDTETAQALERELSSIALELKTGSLTIDESAEDIHSFIEGILTARLGDRGRMVHAGRSRNDQVVTDCKLYLKQTVPALSAELEHLIAVLLERAEAELETIMPGYTHLQRAQPVTVAHHLVAWCAALFRDRGRLNDALCRLNECPLGSGALAGSGLAIDRAATAAALGFAGPTLNSMDSVADRDFAVELAAACALIQVHLSRFCEDIVLWSSSEFGFLSLADTWSTGSSIMPQKKNPDFAELIRGKSGRTTGNLVSLLTMLKGIPYAYNKDLQEDKEALFDSLDTVSQSLRMFCGMIESARFNRERLAQSCRSGFLEATDLADYLVRKGMPFRTAHAVVAHLVRDCSAAGKQSIDGMSLAQLQSYSELFDTDLYQILKPESCIAARRLPGGPAPEAVRRQIDLLRREINV
ncbi:MAG: argininosuccinate lyase [Spirochaetaceae bacterium]|jgi:argininosuccinate lyase|nr:argininosuccinate lyase [Spirochaetaceae bacterium]